MFKKGNIPWHKGKKHTEEYKRKMSESCKGIPKTEQTKSKMKGRTPWNKGKKGVYKHSPEILEKMSKGQKGKPRPWLEGKPAWNKGIKGVYTRSDETKKKMSLTAQGRSHEYMKGDKNWKWRGGVSFDPYPAEFNKSLKLKIRTRDNFTCQLCGKSEDEELKEFNRVLCVNHIDFNKKNCSEENLNTLCLRCNLLINWDREKWTNYFYAKNIT